MAKRLDSEIKVVSNGDWIFRGMKIEHREVLAYFRKNLKEGPDGVYIDNRYGDLSENGYLLLEGYPLNLIRVGEENGELLFFSDAGEEWKLSELDLIADREGTLIAKRKGNRLLKYRIARNVAADLSRFLEETDQGLVLRTKTATIQLPETEEGPEVPLPPEFRS
ncbi:hypothetical protein EHO60_11895 [Leptospira fletcheri]|uniref:DUF1285 domain-containing protein n=1 Tax=Leptospira fletcheri TaxID=2484981 RepID=A0A4R9GDY3_9LEPT|nr:hypothetical protein [Leptospira fletcheri]TGK10044.1 hypothetical protein EHO60_11895 [Leptospira fletcheri]